MEIMRTMNRLHSKPRACNFLSFCFSGDGFYLCFAMETLFPCGVNSVAKGDTEVASVVEENSKPPKRISKSQEDKQTRNYLTE
jgi:hypothetical protein